MRNPSWLWLDVAVVFAFVALGRRTHEEAETLSGLLRTAAPFVLALLAGWFVTRAWGRPADLKVGLGVWVVTVGAGMIVRRVVFEEGTATSFIVVASLFLALGLLGWRLVAWWVSGRRSGAATEATEPDAAVPR